MKKICLLATVMIMMSTIASAQVGTDKELHVPIRDYKTYSWTRDIDMIPLDKIFIGPNNVLVYNNLSTRSKIKEAIQYELSAKGYTMSSNPDFLVSFMVLEQPTDLYTYDGYKMLYNGLDSTRTRENLERTHVDAGTVMIKFIDAKSGKQVWQGYNSGALNADMLNSNMKVRGAIERIFNQFAYRAKK